MARSPKRTPRPYRGKAYWSILEEAALIQLLFERRDEMTSRFTFKEPVFQQVVSVLKRLREKGVEKNADSCRSKWRRVCIFILYVFYCTCVVTGVTM